VQKFLLPTQNLVGGKDAGVERVVNVRLWHWKGWKGSLCGLEVLNGEMRIVVKEMNWVRETVIVVSD